MIMVADPVRRAHAQQTAWLHNRCYRDAREAAKAKAQTSKSAKGGHDNSKVRVRVRARVRVIGGADGLPYLQPEP